MNQFSLVPEEGDYGLCLMPAIDGRLLCDIVREVELPFAEREGHPSIAGKYSGIPKQAAILPSRHFLGEPEPYYRDEEGTVYLMVCTCGDAGCWPFVAVVTVTDREVIWSSYRQPHRNKPKNRWDYSKLPEFHFDRQQYEQALADKG